MSNISSIDDLLMGVGNSQQPATPEHKEKLQEQPEPVEEIEKEDDVHVEYESDPIDETDDSSDDSDDDAPSKDENPSSKDEKAESSDEEDEYGNPKEHLNKNMKKRLDKIEKNHQQEVAQRDYEIAQLRAQLANQNAPQQVQQAAKDFQYDPNDETSWQQQLTDFVKQTISSVESEKQTKVKQIEEENVQREFHKKFTQGMNRFGDFREVVGSQPIDDAMTMALRGMNDPSAFIYAASKRQPQELERISKLADPYARMVEMGKLEERMRRNKPTTQAPRPLGRTKEDSTARVTPKQKDMTGDDLLAKADAKRLANVKTRHRNNR